MTDEDYENLICGGLTKRETEIMFECLWGCRLDMDIDISGTGDEKYYGDGYVITILEDYTDELSIDIYGEIDGQTVYYPDKINNMLEALQLPLLISENYSYWYSLFDFYINCGVDLYFEDTGDEILMGDCFVDSIPNECHAEIIDSKYNDEEMRIVFGLYRSMFDDIGWSPICYYFNYGEAVLLKDESGKYYLSEVHEYDGYINNEDTETVTVDASDTWKDAYKDIIENDAYWGIERDYFNNSYFSREYIISRYGDIIDTQYTLITLSDEDIPYLAIKERFSNDGNSEYQNKECYMWYIYKYFEGVGFRCFCEIMNGSDGDCIDELSLTTYDNQLAWYWNKKSIAVYDLCIGGWYGTIISDDSDTEEELTAAKDAIIYHDISDTSFIDNY